MSTRTALTVVGGIVGAYFGYPQLGLVVGGLIGGAVDPQQIQGPKINDTTAQTSADGVPRVIIYGTCDCYGNVIQTGQLVKVEVEESQGKGGPEVTSERAYRTYAIRICEGPIANVLRIWADNKLVYDIRNGSGMLEESEAWVSNKVLYLGDEAQLPDPTLVSSVNADTPSYRGTAYIVFVQEDLTSRQGSIPQYRFEVAKDVAESEVGALTGSEHIESFISGGENYERCVFMSPEQGIGVQVGTRLVNAQTISGNTPYYIRHIDESCNIASTTAIALNGDWHDAGIPYPNSVNILAYRGTMALVFDNTFQGGIGGYNLMLASGGDYVSTLWFPGIGNGWFFSAERLHQEVWFSDTHIYIGSVTHNSINFNNIARWPFLMGGAVSADAVTNGITNVDGEDFWTHLGNDGKLRALNRDSELKTYSANLTLLEQETLPFVLNPTRLMAFAVDDSIAAFLTSVDESSGDLEIRNTSDWSLIQTISNEEFGLRHELLFRIVFTETGLFVQCGDEILRYQYTQSGGVGEPILLSEIVSDVHDRCGFSADGYDVSELTDEVAGLALAGDYSGADAITALRQVYFFDKSEHDKKLWYPKRGAAVIETLTIDELTEVPDTTQRNQAIEIPKKLHLKYKHAASGYSPVKATIASSSPDISSTGEVTLEVPVVLNEDQAAQVAEKMYKVTRSEIGGDTIVTVPMDVGAKYVSANCLGLSLRGMVSRQRIEEIEFSDWKLKLTLKPDRQSAYTSDLTGVPIPPPTLPPSTIVGQTEIAVLDISARVDSEDDLNYLVAVSGRLPPWYGATYQRSLDGGANFTSVLDIPTASIMGELVSSVDDADEHYTDTTNTVVVSLYRDNQSIDSITEQQFLSEGGAFALEKADGSWELMQYLNAAEDSNGDFVLSTLHRGLLNSGTSSHLAGARFVMLQRPSHVSSQASWINQVLTHRAISFGDTADNTTNQFSETFVGRSQIEWPVAYLELSRSGSDITASWTPRHRFGSDDFPVASVNFQGYRVTATDGVTTETIDTLTPEYSGTWASPVTVTVSSLNRITGAGPATSESI